MSVVISDCGSRWPSKRFLNSSPRNYRVYSYKRTIPSERNPETLRYAYTLGEREKTHLEMDGKDRLATNLPLSAVTYWRELLIPSFSLRSKRLEPHIFNSSFKTST